jgi:putative membrane protein insertion efficiency factor
MTTTRTPPSVPVPAPVGSVGRPSLPVRAALALLKGYQAAASGRVSPCRFYPSCSNYAAEAFTVHGFWRGLALSARRLLRCRPFGPHGVDLVPLPAHPHSHSLAPALALAPSHEEGRP